MKLQAEEGQGGKPGHSNMVRHAKTADIKEAANQQRRFEAKQIAQLLVVTIRDGKKRPPDAEHQPSGASIDSHRKFCT